MCFYPLKIDSITYFPYILQLCLLLFWKSAIGHFEGILRRSYLVPPDFSEIIDLYDLYEYKPIETLMKGDLSSDKETGTKLDTVSGARNSRK